MSLPSHVHLGKLDEVISDQGVPKSNDWCPCKKATWRDTQGEDSHVMLEVQTHSAAIVTGDEELGGALDFSTLGQ